ncbi:MAG: hypothetical protein NWF03_07525 [Candidatus Bathyarchaeota archaeon]|nr:hypothetical protein [Candidatus Bathyarchaeota archaeon]
MVQVMPVSAATEDSIITRTITDEGVDTDNDDFFDYLLVGVELNITDAGTYIVEIDGLLDSSSVQIDVTGKNSTYLTAGTHVVYIKLSGFDIYYAGYNPLMLAIVNLYNTTDNVIDTEYSVTLSQEYTYDQFQEPLLELEVDSVKREIFIDQIGRLYVFNSYTITNLGYKTKHIPVALPEDATKVQVRDEMGTLSNTIFNNTVKAGLGSALETGETKNIYVLYDIPWDTVVTQADGGDYSLVFTFLEEDMDISKLTATITLPKGATFESATPSAHSKEETDRITLTYIYNNVEPSDNLSLTVNFHYSLVWSSLYPTIWVGILAFGASAIAFFRKAPKTAVAATAAVQPTALKDFVDTYEEKMTIRTELESLEEKLTKGKIPRRRYKVRRKMLEGRLSSASRTLSTLSDSIRSAGSKYASMVRQIEVAETKLESAQMELKRVEARYRRGEISKGAYGKLVEEYQSRIQDAEATIDGVLLRLRD